jgi:hypothetical protein
MYKLYVKTHNITGLKYLGKTNNKNPHKYRGSGTYWKRHIAVHGYDVTTEILLITDDYDELKETGKFFSRLWGVVRSNEWANLMDEKGDGGNTSIKRLEMGTHNFQDSNYQSRIQKRRISEGRHNLQSGNRTPTTGFPKGGKHAATRRRNFGETNPFRGAVPCVDIVGNNVMVPREVYASQTRINKADWEFVHTKSKEAKLRKRVCSSGSEI